MPLKARLGDAHSHGGTIIEGSPDVTTNGIPTARIIAVAFAKYRVPVFYLEELTVIVEGAPDA